MAATWSPTTGYSQSPSTRAYPFRVPTGRPEDWRRQGTGLASALGLGLTPDGRGQVENQGLDVLLGLSSELAGREDQNRAGAIGFLTGQFNRANAASGGMTPDEINQRMGRATDAAAGQSLDQWSGLRDMLGGAGITGGGLAAGLGAQIELGRLAQIQGSKRDLAIYEAERRSKAASDQYLRSLGLAEIMAQGPSDRLLGTMESIFDYRQNERLGRAQIGLAREGLEVQKDAADQAFWGNIFQGGASILAGIL